MCLLADARNFSSVSAISFCVSCMMMTTCWSGFAATSWALRCSAAAAGKTAQSARCMETRAAPIMGDEEKALRVG